MDWNKVFGRTAVIALTACYFLFPVLAQEGRGKAELKGIKVDYGKPTSKTDRVGELAVGGGSWRMGKDTSTTFTTPVDLMLGSVHLAKGSYSLWLNRPAAERYELVFNSQTGQWGTSHDASKDVGKVPLTKESLPNLVETFTIELKEAPKGGAFILTWGKTKLSADFMIH